MLACSAGFNMVTAFVEGAVNYLVRPWTVGETFTLHRDCLWRKA